MTSGWRSWIQNVYEIPVNPATFLIRPDFHVQMVAVVTGFRWPNILSALLNVSRADILGPEPTKDHGLDRKKSRDAPWVRRGSWRTRARSRHRTGGNPGTRSSLCWWGLHGQPEMKGELERSISSFRCSLTRNITAYSMKSLAQDIQWINQ